MGLSPYPKKVAAACIAGESSASRQNPGQPYAAFATNFLDFDNDPGFLFVPPTSAGFRHELPNRYLIYSD